MVLEYIIIGFNGILIGAIAFFIKQLVNKITETGQQLISIDKSMAVIASEIKHFESKFTALDKYQEKTEREIFKIRERLHALGNDLMATQSKCMVKHESD